MKLSVYYPVHFSVDGKTYNTQVFDLFKDYTETLKIAGDKKGTVLTLTGTTPVYVILKIHVTYLSRI